MVVAQQENPGKEAVADETVGTDGRAEPPQAPERRAALRTMAAWSAAAPLAMVLLDSTRTYADSGIFDEDD